MKSRIFRAAALVLAAGCASAANEPAASGDGQARRAPAAPSIHNTVWQLSPFAMLVDGAVVGPVTAGQVRQHGNLGVGAADSLDGEFAVVDGRFYQFMNNGNVRMINDPSSRLPFAIMTQWDPGNALSLDLADRAQFTDALIPTVDMRLPTTDAFYALMVTGTWREVRARTFKKQVPPFRRLTPEDQDIYTMTNVKGVMVGFREPRYADSLGLANYHLHFITTDRTPQRGGHVLSFTAGPDVTLHYSLRPYYTLYVPPAPAR